MVRKSESLLQVSALIDQSAHLESLSDTEDDTQSTVKGSLGLACSKLVAVSTHQPLLP